MSKSDEQYNLCDKADGQKKAGAAETSQKLKVTVKLTSDGFIFAYGDREAGPFRSRSDVDEVAVAAKLSGLGPSDIEQWRRHPGANREKWIIQPQDILVAKLDAARCMRYEAPPTLKNEEGRIDARISKYNIEQVDRSTDSKLDIEIRDLESARRTFHIELRKAIEEKDERTTREIRWWILITESLLWPKIREWLDRNRWGRG